MAEPVQYVDAESKPLYVSENTPFPVSLSTGEVVINGDVTVANEVAITNDSESPVPVVGTVNTLNGLEIPAHDYVANTYTDGNLTQTVYKTGGSSGTVVATVAMTYNEADQVLTVTRT